MIDLDRDERRAPPIPASPGWWAIYAFEPSGEDQPCWAASPVVAWLPVETSQALSNSRFGAGAYLYPITAGLDEMGCAMLDDSENLIGVLHESEMAPDVRVLLPDTTGDVIARVARRFLERRAKLAKR